MISTNDSCHQLRVGIDARLSGSEHAGIGRYIQNLIKELIILNPKNIKFVLFFNHQQQKSELQKQVSSKLLSQHQIIFAPIRHYSIAEQIKWLKLLNQQHLDLLHVPHFNIPIFYKKKLVITIHDLLWHQQVGAQATTLPSWKYYLKYLAYRYVTNQAVKKAEQILVPTKAVKKTLTKFYAEANDKITVTYEGISQKFQKILKEESISKAKIDKHQLIYVGSLYPHKNIEVVLQALKQNSTLKLIISCSRNIFLKRTQQRIKELKLENQVKITGFVSDKVLIELMQSSLALVQPSKSEGFGLTALEAMAAGVPVIASNLAVFKELYQSAPLYFDVQNSKELLSAVKKLQNPQIRKEHVQLGLKIAKKYSWNKMAKVVLDEYQKLLKNE